MDAAVELPKSIQRVVDLAIKMIDPDRIVLYGSRARGTARPLSDYDIAFFGLKRPHEWSRYWCEVEFEPLTLYHLDLVNGEDADESLLGSILREGVVLYERGEA